LNCRTPEDKKLITATAAFCSPMVKGYIQEILEKEGYSCEEKEKGWEEFLEIKAKDEKEVKAQFFLHNLYLEIATKDRDDEPLEWDTRLLDSSFFQEKATTIIFSKIRPLLIALSTNDAKKLDEKLTKLAKSEGFRMRMTLFDKNERSENEDK